MQRTPPEGKTRSATQPPHAGGALLAPAPHGGDLSRARAIYGGDAEDWLDLSTGINASGYRPASPAPTDPVWRRLPDADLSDATAAAARRRYGAAPNAIVLPAPGAQGALQATPRLLDGPDRRAAIVSPTYAEHARAFAAAGWRVDPVAEPEAAGGAAAAVVVNPNNPDGRRWERDRLLRLADTVGLLIVDESFVDETPDASLAGDCGDERLLVLRSLGKFYGLAGLRLGFAISGPRLGAALGAALGPWPVSGPALRIGREALLDDAWADAARRRLRGNAIRLRATGETLGLRSIGGGGLFHTFETGDAGALQAALAARRIWTRVFPDLPGWIRLGAPGPEADWARLEAACAALGRDAFAAR